MCVQEEKFQVGFSCTQTLIHNKKNNQANSIYACLSPAIYARMYTYIHDFIYPYSDRQKAEKIHNNANMRNRHTVNGIEWNVWGAEVEPTKNMITQRRQANNTQVSPSTSLSVCMCQYGVHMYVCVCVCESTAGAPERANERQKT